MKAIITPTYRGHFQFIKNYLKSFDKYLLDKDMPICFIIDKSENEEFSDLIKPYKNLNIKIYYLDEILKHFNIEESPEECLKKYGRLSFQTIKKLYGGLYSKADEFLFLDSESELIKPTNINSLFDKYFEHPFIFLSRCSERCEKFKESFVYNYTLTASKIIGIEPDFWGVESYQWFYKREILLDLIKEIGEPIEIIKNNPPTGKFYDLEGVLEALLYRYFIYKHKDKYNYEIKITQDEFRKYLGKEIFDEFFSRFENSALMHCGILEAAFNFVNDKMTKGLIELFNENNFSIVRSAEIYDNYKFQKEIIDNTDIKILASEQNHLFGINLTIKNRILYVLGLFSLISNYKNYISQIKYKNPVSRFFSGLNYAIRQHMEENKHLKMENLEQYLKNIDFSSQYNKLIKKYKNKKIIIYGAGKLFQYINEKYDLSKLNIIGISDKSFETTRIDKFLGYRAILPNEIYDNDFDIILVATINWEKLVNLHNSILIEKKMPNRKAYPLACIPIKSYFKTN